MAYTLSLSSSSTSCCCFSSSSSSLLYSRLNPLLFIQRRRSGLPCTTTTTTLTTRRRSSVKFFTAAEIGGGFTSPETAKSFDFTNEERIYKWWESQGYFKPCFDRGRDPFVVSMPPPNVTGSLHMGNAMFVTLEDIMVRFNRMKVIEICSMFLCTPLAPLFFSAENPKDAQWTMFSRCHTSFYLLWRPHVPLTRELVHNLPAI